MRASNPSRLTNSGVWQPPIILILSIVWCVLPFTSSARAYAISPAVEQSTKVDHSVSAVSSSFFDNNLAARSGNTMNLQTTTSSSPCGSDPCASSTTSSASCASSDSCASSTTSSASCGSSNPCAKSTTETEIHLATMTLRTTDMQTIYATDHITITQTSTRIFTKNVNIAETITMTSTITGCSTFTTSITSLTTTTTTRIFSEPPSSSGCGSSSCTVTTTVATDVDVPTSTTAAGSAKISGHDVVEVVSEEKVKEIIAKDKKNKEMAEKKKEKDIVDRGLPQDAARLVARQSMGTDGGFSTGGKRATEDIIILPDTTLRSKTRHASSKTETVDIKTITQYPSYSAEKSRSNGPEAEMGILL